jgi:hypothetical protein
MSKEPCNQSRLPACANRSSLKLSTLLLLLLPQEPNSELLQNKSPKVDAATLAPAAYAADPHQEW